MIYFGKKMKKSVKFTYYLSTIVGCNLDFIMFKHLFFLIIGSQLLLSSPLFAVLETKRFDAKTPERSKYLNYMMPQGLRFSELTLQAD